MSDTVTINDKEYKVEELSEKSRTILARLNFIGQDAERLNAQMDVLRAADAQLKALLKEELNAMEAEVTEE